MARVKTGPKLILIALIAVGVVFGLKKATEKGIIPTPGIMKAIVPQKAVLPELRDAPAQSPQSVAQAPLPAAAPATIQAPQVRIAIWAWNSQVGLIYANGGAQTAKGSLMEKRAVNLLLYRQDDTSQMQADLIACAKEIAGGASQCSTGANAVIIMGDGAGQFAAAVNPQLKKLGPTYAVRVIGSVGYSRGEDAFMAPAEVKSDPQKARGIVVAGVLRDGDWNIALKWMGDNGVPNNPDEHTYDPEAVNWLNSTDYNAAAADYVAGKCEDRKVVRSGRLTGETKRVCVNAVVTWTPGDVTVAKQKGGLVKVVSTKEYRSQMPGVILGPKAFFDKNREEIQNLLAAAFEGGDQVRAYDSALKKAAELSAKLYKDQDGPYWYRYYKGVAEADATGVKISLGGSSANNLADNLILFGLQPGTNDNFRSTYTTFANIVTQQYPDMFKDTKDEERHIPDVKEVEDKSFITGAQAIMSDAGAVADLPRFEKVDVAKATVVSKRSYEINFNSGEATLTAEGERQLRALMDSIAITALSIKVDGYTDSTGNETRVNLPLSVARAQAIKSYLVSRAPENFPDARFVEVSGHGSQRPVAPNTTPQGRAKNRRVEIALLGQ